MILNYMCALFSRWNGIYGNEPNGSHAWRTRWNGQKINTKNQHRRRWAFQKTEYGFHRRWKEGPGSC